MQLPDVNGSFLVHKKELQEKILAEKVLKCMSYITYISLMYSVVSSSRFGDSKTTQNV